MKRLWLPWMVAMSTTLSGCGSVGSMVNPISIDSGAPKIDAQADSTSDEATSDSADADAATD